MASSYFGNNKAAFLEQWMERESLTDYGKEFMRQQFAAYPEGVERWITGLDAEKGLVSDELNPEGLRYTRMMGYGDRFGMVTTSQERQAYKQRGDALEKGHVPLFKGQKTQAAEGQLPLFGYTPNPKINVENPVGELKDKSWSGNKQPFLKKLKEGLKEGYIYSLRGTSSPTQYFLGPLASIPTPQNPAGFGGTDGKELRNYLKKQGFGKTGLVAAHLGNIAGEFLNYWPIRVRWRSDANDLLSTYLPGYMAEKTKIGQRDWGQGVENEEMMSSPQTRRSSWRPGMDIHITPGKVIRRHHALPIGIAGVAAMNIFSGNTDPLKLFDTEEGPRPKGYRAAESDYDTPTKTGFYPLALAGAISGGSTRPLNWTDIQRERPDISETEYQDYMRYYYGDTDESEQPFDFNILNGMFKFTPTNLEGMPEVRALGSRFTLPGIAAGIGAAAGTAYILKKALAKELGTPPGTVAGTTPGEGWDVLKSFNYRNRRPT